MGLLINIQARRLPESVGNKALNLRRLYNYGIRIPPAFICDWNAYHRYLDNDVSLVNELRLELSRKLDPDKYYAVRSSGNIEDSLDRSFAGQFKSVLNARGIDAILQAIWSVWSSTQSPAVVTYLERHNIAARQLSMAVIIQEMVQSQASGVALSRNPVTGADEVVVEAVRGLGDALVQGGVTPERWINKWGNWLVKPDSESIPLAIIDEVVNKTREITRKLKSHVDIEWAFDGKDLYFLQVREITTLNRHNVYSNHISKEVLPGIIKPLIDSVNIPLVCTMWVRLLNEMLGKTRAKPEELAKSFYYRVYFNMGVLGKVFEDVGMPADSVELMMNLLPEGTTKPSMKPTMKSMLRLPSMLKFALEKWYFAPKMRRALPQLEEELKQFDFRSAGKLSESELLTEMDRLHDVVQNVAYYNIVGPILMGMFNAGLKTQLKKAGVDFKNFDLMEDYPEIEKYDPKTYLHELNHDFMGFAPQLQEKIRTATYGEFMKLEGLDEFQRKVAGFLERFGHLSDNGNDFSSVPWRESPEMVLGLIANYIPAKEGGVKKIHFSEIKTNRMIHALYTRAREFRFLREQVSSMYTFGYGLFRYYYLELGRILAQRGWLDDPNDIFYLTDAEVKNTMTSLGPLADYRAIINQHKSDIERYRNIPLPPIIYGDVPPPVQDPSLKKLIGIPTSLGHYTGKVAVVRGIQDFQKVQQGDVLVIPYSDVGWTPLFARAGAVVSESGGLLSHSSIVAREYNIPAVVSADGAMRLRDQTIVTVNGHTGEVIIHSSETL
jgi:phosphohistidine swiveling domain-containing protein